MTLKRKDVERRIGEIVHGRIALNEPVSAHTTLRVGGPADMMVFPETVEELCGVLRFARSADLPLFVLGRGSDLIVRDGGFRGVCIRLGKGFRGSRVVGECGIDALAGEPYPSLLRTARHASLTGFEYLATVPGTVGGGVATNVGAYNRSFADFIEEIHLLDASGTERVIPVEEMAAHYRLIELPAGSVVTRVLFRLAPGRRDAIEEAVRRYASYRRKTQPLRAASAGCIFKNPDTGPQAGLLIDRAGLKGLAVGGAEISDIHGNFLVNRGGATAEEVLELIQIVRHRVFEKYGIHLDMEVRVVGEEQLI